MRVGSDVDTAIRGDDAAEERGGELDGFDFLQVLTFSEDEELTFFVADPDFTISDERA